MNCCDNEMFEGRDDLGEPVFTCTEGCGKQYDKNGTIIFEPCKKKEE